MGNDDDQLQRGNIHQSFSELKVEQIEELIHGPPSIKVALNKEPVTPTEPRCTLLEVE